MLPLLDAIIPFVQGVNSRFKGAWPIHAACPLSRTGATKLLIKYACISLTSRQRATKRKPSWHVAKGWTCGDFQRWQSYPNRHAVRCSSCLVQWRVLTVCCHRKPPVVELQPWCMTRATHKTGQATSRIDQDEIELSSNTRIIAIHKCAKEAKSIDDFTPDLVTLLINQRLVELIDMLNF